MFADNHHGCDPHMGTFVAHLSPIETLAKVEAVSESRSIEDLPNIICCSFGRIPVFFDRFILGTTIAQALSRRSDFSSARKARTP